MVGRGEKDKGAVVDFRIADTFTDSFARLTSGEQKVVKTTAFSLQMNPANPGMSFQGIPGTSGNSGEEFGEFGGHLIMALS